MTSRSHRPLAALAIQALVATSCLTLGATAVPAAAQAPAANTALSPEALRQDFAVVRSVLKEVHPGTERYVSAAALDAALDEAERGLDRPMTDQELLTASLRAVNTIRDGHTALTLSEAGEAALRESVLTPPFIAEISNGRLFVRRDLAPTARSDISGREIAAINGRPVGEILAAMTPLVAVDGAGTTRIPARLSGGLRFNRLFGLLYGSSERFEIQLANAEGSGVAFRSGLSVASLDQAWRERFPDDRAARPPLELAFRDQDATAVLTVRAFENFMDESRSKTVGAAMDEAFDAIKARGARVLVLDLRDNGGGQDGLGRLLFQHIADRPFDYYRGLYAKTLEPWSFAAYSQPPGPVPPGMFQSDAQGRLAMAENPNLGRHEPTTNRFAGRVIVLMNGNSFSTTSEFLSVAHNAHRAVFVGEEAGGGYYGNTSGPVITVTLPNSGLVLRSPLLRYELAVDGFEPADRGVPPHFEVAPTVQDRIAGRDPVMERALDIARRRPDRDAMDPETAP